MCLSTNHSPSEQQELLHSEARNRFVFLINPLRSIYQEGGVSPLSPLGISRCRRPPLAGLCPGSSPDLELDAPRGPLSAGGHGAKCLLVPRQVVSCFWKTWGSPEVSVEKHHPQQKSSHQPEEETPGSAGDQKL